MSVGTESVAVCVCGKIVVMLNMEAMLCRFCILVQICGLFRTRMPHSAARVLTMPRTMFPYPMFRGGSLCLMRMGQDSQERPNPAKCMWAAFRQARASGMRGSCSRTTDARAGTRAIQSSESAFPVRQM